MEYEFKNKEIKPQKLEQVSKPHEYTVAELEHELAPPPPAILTSLPKKEGNSGFKSKHKESEVFSISPEKIKQAEESLKKEVLSVSKKDLKDLSTSRTSSLQTPSPSKDYGMSKNKITVAVQRNNPQQTSDKTRMNDILKPSSKLQGPLEEISSLDLIKFRRLGDNPDVTVKKIENKIRLLEEESFTKRQQGVSAWRHSPVHQIYITLGQESFSKGQSVEDLIKLKQKNKMDTLTIDEFNAILELNTKLRV